MEFRSHDESSQHETPNHADVTSTPDVDELFDVELLRAAIAKLLEQDPSLSPFHHRPWNRARYRHPKT